MEGALLNSKFRCTQISNDTSYVNIFTYWFYEYMVSGAVYKINWNKNLPVESIINLLYIIATNFDTKRLSL